MKSRLLYQQAVFCLYFPVFGGNLPENVEYAIIMTKDNRSRRGEAV
ncbi:hypothetical protein BACCAP_00430 [Pseudoflavonifractor capillosus ATCC 29799]|uniref:Uncharacterized protein n=1 Tax=Pseudoflavonifractor capillosus ATCC 29799 TaxID=411467 RepID=A6NQG0_9FIRM|nr:hypothetical protein BACCAP_00430 [Pseudoflavonifractor capillosus ATCC 29799]